MTENKFKVGNRVKGIESTSPKGLGKIIYIETGSLPILVELDVHHSSAHDGTQKSDICKKGDGYYYWYGVEDLKLISKTKTKGKSIMKNYIVVWEADEDPAKTFSTLEQAKTFVKEMMDDDFECPETGGEVKKDTIRIYKITQELKPSFDVQWDSVKAQPKKATVRKKK